MAGSDYEEWDRIYRKYPLDTLPWELGRPRQTLIDLVKSGRIKKGKTLDLCCGAGSNTVYLAKEGFQVTAIDISSKAVEISSKKAEEANVKIKFLVQSFLELPFKSEEFDFVFDMGCFHHVKPWDRHVFIEGVHRVLKKNGTYFLICFSYKNGSAWNHFTKRQLMRLFSGSFEFKEIRHIASTEGDGFIRYFYWVLMEKK